ncbi:MAG: NADH-quinone oxidoreductase subunit C [Bacteroides sp.]|nr:MAG: NADH-quinone oxidoreductase subunit C [Bacteroides sp.]
MIKNDEIIKLIKYNYPIVNILDNYNTLEFSIDKKNLKSVIFFLKYEKKLNFIFLIDITAVHYPNKKNDLMTVYHLYSFLFKKRIRIKCYLSTKNPIIDSITSIFKSANWMERETYDFFGIIFKNHPCLKRILNVDDMVDFPMRKNFALEDSNRSDKEDHFFGR